MKKKNYSLTILFFCKKKQQIVLFSFRVKKKDENKFFRSVKQISTEMSFFCLGILHNNSMHIYHQTTINQNPILKYIFSISFLSDICQRSV